MQIHFHESVEPGRRLVVCWLRVRRTIGTTACKILESGGRGFGWLCDIERSRTDGIIYVLSTSMS